MTVPELSRRAAIAAMFAGAGAAGVSGEVMAAELGISRVAVAKHVTALRALGYAIDAAPRAGYRLAEAPDACIPEEVAWRLRNPLWVRCEGGAEVGSTNDEAKALARAGAPEGTLVVAARQTAGRGRLGRTWESPGGGAYMSCVLRPPLPPAAVAPLALVVGIGAARGLEPLGVPVGLKWPNDLEADGRKLGGVLLEMAAEADHVEWVVIGCGVNVAQAAHDRGAYVREWAPAAVADVAAAVLDGIAGAYADFNADGFGALRAEYEVRWTLAGQGVVVRDATGAVVAEGVASGVGDGGELLVSTGGALTAVHAGEVTLRG